MTLTLDQCTRLVNVAALGSVAATDLFNRVGFGFTLPFLNVKDYGALGDNVTDDRVAVVAALAAAAATGQAVYFPPGNYIVSRAGSAPYSIDMPANNITLLGVSGASWLKHPVGMPNNITAILRLNEVSNITIFGLGFDGNWGNSVGGTDSQAGINHTTQADPKNYGLMIRGGTNITVQNVNFQQTYGDAIWVGASAGGIRTNHVDIFNCNMNMSARNGITLTDGAHQVTISDCDLTNIFAGTIDTEPVSTFGGTRDIFINNCRLNRWWSDAVIRLPLSIVGSDNTSSDSSAARGYRVSNTIIYGPVLISNAYDCVIDRCRVFCDYSATSFSPIYIDHVSEDVTISNTYVYDRAGTAGDTHIGAVAVRHYITSYRPTRIRLKNLTIQARNGRHGICIDGSGGVSSDSGTSTATTATTLVDGSKSWTTNQFTGALVVTGGVMGAINTNTATTLTIFGWLTAPSADLVATTPGTGSYKIIGRNGDVLVDQCYVDCTDDGNGQGGLGLYIDAGDITAKPGNEQIKVRGLTVRNATGDAVQVQSRTGANPIRHLSLDRIHAVDDQVTPTCTVAVRFNTGIAVNITKIQMRNITVDGVASVFAGVGTASPNLIRWLVIDGEAAVWEGFGAPAFSAAKGTTYLRKDGGAGTTLYVNESGSTTWAAK
jgi:pectate lyase-like protein